MVQLLRKELQSKSNWRRMLDAADKLDFEDGRLIAGKGWRIDDFDVFTASAKLTELKIPHEKYDRYTIYIL